jgi:hypothetical protein
VPHRRAEFKQVDDAKKLAMRLGSGLPVGHHTGLHFAASFEQHQDA